MKLCLQYSPLLRPILSTVEELENPEILRHPFLLQKFNLDPFDFGEFEALALSDNFCIQRTLSP